VRGVRRRPIVVFAAAVEISGPQNGSGEETAIVSTPVRGNGSICGHAPPVMLFLCF
jgi:hypothetical protein